MAEDKYAAKAGSTNPVMNVDWGQNQDEIDPDDTVAWVNDKLTPVTIIFDFPEGSPFDDSKFTVPPNGVFEHVSFDAAPGEYHFRRVPPPTAKGLAGDPKIIIT